jgi:hypothetical protein
MFPPAAPYSKWWAYCPIVDSGASDSLDSVVVHSCCGGVLPLEDDRVHLFRIVFDSICNFADEANTR